VGIWDERKLAKRLRIAAKEVNYLKGDVKRLSDELCGVEGDGDRADAQRERGESWSEVVDGLDNALEELDSALDNVESLLS
jgi:hypothetical protein